MLIRLLFICLKFLWLIMQGLFSIDIIGAILLQHSIKFFFFFFFLKLVRKTLSKPWLKPFFSKSKLGEFFQLIKKLTKKK